MRLRLGLASLQFLCVHSNKSSNHLLEIHESIGLHLTGEVLFPCLVDKHHHLTCGKGKIISSQKSLSRHLYHQFKFSKSIISESSITSDNWNNLGRKKKYNQSTYKQQLVYLSKKKGKIIKAQ